MPYHYLTNSDAESEHRLPSVETFRVSLATPQDECPTCNADDELWDRYSDRGAQHGEACVGWYYAFGLPGCLWDGEPIGPFETEAEALKAARAGTHAASR